MLIGTFNQAEWETMKMLRESLAWYRKQSDFERFRNAFEKERKMLKEYYGRKDV
jgi:hypothetical protein